MPSFLSLRSPMTHLFSGIASRLASHRLHVVPLLRWTIFIATCLLVAVTALRVLRPQMKFLWCCFIRPIGTADQRTRLDKFYQGQADVYDGTRTSLLRGRQTMLSLSASHLRVLRASSSSKRLVWVDIGGGTGYNIELMHKYFPISSFDAVYLIDLCESMLEVARKRFAKRGWNNVHILCQDASEFSLPEWSNGNDPKGSVGFVTMSYSLSMIPSFYALLDRIDYVLSPKDGLLGVVDFYTSGKQSSPHERAIGGARKECGWLSRWFWQIWFEFDYISLSPHRRDYLEYKFGTIKSYNGRNRFILPFIVRIPYFIWLGRSRSCDVSRFCHAFEIEGGNMVGNGSPKTLTPTKETEMILPLEIGLPAIDIPEHAATFIDVAAPLSSFHYQVKKTWRLPYYDHPVHKEFRTFVYSFTWEDPIEDLKYLNLGRNDSVFVITSAGDNALHYAIAAKPRSIHCVDMNPCQGHLLELKLAAIQSLSFEEFFNMFGNGRIPNFRAILDSRIAPFISSTAYQFWRLHEDDFSSSFYLCGYSGWAIRLTQIIFSLAGVSKEVEAICHADNIVEQARIWREKIRPILLNPLVVALLKNPIFCWNALGVPLNQRRMLLSEGSVYEFIRDTLDPLASAYHFKTGAYFYLLTLLGHYTPDSCPAYLTREGFEALRNNDGDVMDSFHLHTDSIVNVLCGLTTSSLTRAVIMDHLDWFPPDSGVVDQEIGEFHRVLAPGGIILWRSAARKPWYKEAFEQKGFTVTALGIRESSKPALDRVNMYASFWRAVKN